MQGPSHKKRVPGAVLDAIGKSISGKIREPNLAEFAQHFVDIIGGERALARMLVDEIRRPECSGNIRAKILQFVLGHVKWVNERSGTIDELGNINTEDLQKVLDDHIRAVAKIAAQKAKAKAETPKVEDVRENRTN